MIAYVVGDLFQSPADVLVNTVNTVGVMGKGIAKKFKAIYPDMFEKYRQLCEKKKLVVGKVWLYKTSNKWILNFPTKNTWRNPSQLEYIEKGLQAFVNGYSQRGITSIAFPALGCGNGELNWESQVRPLMEKYLKPLPIDVFIYIYKKNAGIPEHKNIKEISQWLRSEPEVLGFSEVWMDLKTEIGPGLDLESFGNKRPFHVEYLAENECLQITANNKTEHIYNEELMNLWNTIRSYGFGFPAIIPPDAAPYQDYLLPLFVKLPYCFEIIAGKNYHAVDGAQTRGIQFLPRPAVSSPLFSRPVKTSVAV
ncbi:MAG: macro domain-containing protein [bacterium]|nr:macro domain-containing protein [bacterium]